MLKTYRWKQLEMSALPDYDASGLADVGNAIAMEDLTAHVA